MDTIEIKGLKLTPTDGMSREVWLRHRDKGLGGSDLGTIMGVNKRQSPTELFYQKCGIGLSSDEINDAMFWGNQLEDVILDKAQYLDLETQTYKEAFLSGTPLRKISKFHYMVQNNEYPWLIGNIDGAINYNGRWKTMDEIAEAKSISRQSAEMWETIPIYHFFQCQGYVTMAKPMLRCESAKIFYLEDGRKLTGWHLPIVHDLRDKMLEASHDFWYKHVLPGREIAGNVNDLDQRLQYLSQYEPPVVDTEAYYKFLSKVYLMKKNFIRIDGNQEDRELAEAYLKLSEKVRAAEAERQGVKNRIMKRLNDSSANIIELDEFRVSFNKKLYVNRRALL